ncbi:amidohydrolase family protein [Luteimonas aquatica]|uniref:amidohydrolase family protein n=1 Tax=Luteimonas aquatica TaxID=450364 RepID=UPI001F59384F|nr:amidohydrolase family protein [Luteimonas aquatica]
MRIDVHAHAWSEAYLDLLAELGNDRTAVHRGLGAGTTPEELEARFALMDSAGIALQVLSATPASPHFADEAAAVRAARFVNDEYAGLARRHPARFRAFASLPLPHVAASLAELARAMDGLGMLGACITTSVLERSIADPAFDALYVELDRRGALLYVHPAGCGACSPLIADHHLTWSIGAPIDQVRWWSAISGEHAPHPAGCGGCSPLSADHHLTWSIGAPIEDTVAALHLILAGIPKRYPRMKIVLSHLGGALPMVLQRVEHQVPWEAPGTPERPTLAARRMWYDTVGHNHPPALRAAVDTLGADRLLLGTDFPYQADDLFRAAVDYVSRAGLAEDAIGAILDRNAAALLGLDAKAEGAP